MFRRTGEGLEWDEKFFTLVGSVGALLLMGTGIALGKELRSASFLIWSFFFGNFVILAAILKLSSLRGLFKGLILLVFAGLGLYLVWALRDFNAWSYLGVQNA